MDPPDVVSRLAILDGVPIVEALTAAMLTLLRHGGIGSSSPNRGNLSAPSSLTRMSGMLARRSRWVPRPTLTSGLPSTTPLLFTAC